MLYSTCTLCNSLFVSNFHQQFGECNECIEEIEFEDYLDCLMKDSASAE